MMANIIIRKMLPIALVLLLAGAASAQTMGQSGGHDLDALWADAQASFTLADQDAVILLESRTVTVADNGDVATRIHRAAWIGTSLGIRQHADLRVPWQSADSDLAVEILRTWREGRWWPDPTRISETAVVHTLPYALDGAADYTSMRETMLLHDGVELPCIVETAYTITEHGRPAADGLFVMPQEDPAVLVQLQVQLPAGMALSHAATNGAPAPVQDGTTWTWSLHGLHGLAQPLTAAPATYEPTVAWSTWASAQELAATWRGIYDEAAAPVGLSGAMAPLREKLRAVTGDLARLRAVASFIESSVRTVHYDDRFWALAPRPADRVWQTAYGHPLDKAVLMAAVLADLGFEAEPLFVGRPLPEDLAAIPGLDRPGALMLGVRQSDTPGSSPYYYDPSDGAFHGPSRVSDNNVIALNTGATRTGEPTPWGSLTVSLVLQPGDDRAWRGSGQVTAGGSLNFGDLAAVSRTALAERIAAVTGSVLADATVAEAGLQEVAANRVVAEFALAVPAVEGDRTRFVVGAPAGGLMAHLPHDVVLSDASRKSPVLGEALLSQDLEVRIDLAGRTVVHQPADRSISNEVGEFTVKVAVADGWLVYHRTLLVGPGPHVASRWPALRSLLLEENDAANGTIVLDGGS